MDIVKITAGISIAGATLAGGIDASVLNEKPIQAVYELKETVVIEQKENTVEATLPWKDQVGLKILYDMGEATAKEKLADKREKQVLVEKIDDSSMKIDIILSEKPETNTFCYTIQGWEQYDFFYQPALTKEEIEQGAVRPEEIVGSYAVYHKTLKNHETSGENYETGKVAHIPYPYVWSVNATSTTKHRAKAFDITDGRMCVTVSSKDLDTMEYPIRVDPTFGYTSIGGTSGDPGAGKTVYGQATPAGSGTLSKFTMYVDWNFSGTSGNFTTALYSDSSNLPNTKIANAGTFTMSNGAAWKDATITESVVGSTNYWFGIYAASSRYIYYWDTTGGVSNIDTSLTVLPTTASPGSNGTRNYSIYATYTASAGTPTNWGTGPQLIWFD